MNPFTYCRPGDVATAVNEASAERAKFIGGGTNLLDLMKEDVERPGRELPEPPGSPIDAQGDPAFPALRTATDPKIADSMR